MQGTLKAWLRRAWIACAVLLAAAALLSLVLRATLPRLEADTAGVERWVARVLGMPVSIARLDAHWHRGLPVLGADGITLHHQADPTLEVLRFTRAEAGLDLLATLRDRQLRLGNLQLTGLELNLLWRADGRLVIDGFTRQDPRFLRWLIAQTGLLIEASRVTLRDERQRFAPLSARDVRLRISREHGDTLLALEASGGDLFPAGLRAEAHLPQGDPASPAARLAMQARDLDGAALVTTFKPDNAVVPPLKGDAWVELRRAEGGGLQVRFALEDLQLATAADTPDGQAPDALGLQGLAEIRDGLLSAQILRVDTAATGAAPVDWRVRWAQDAFAPGGPALVVSADSFALPLLRRLQGWLPAGMAAWPLPTAGTVENLRLARTNTNDGLFFAAGEVHELTLPATPGSPAARNLRAEFLANGRGGALWFDGTEFDLSHPERLPSPVTLAGLEGHLLWQTRKIEGLQIDAQLEGSANSLPFKLAGRWQHAQPSAPVVDVEAELGSGDLSRLSGLVPLGALRPGGERWIRAAFPAGVLKHARITLRGALDKFPFATRAHDEIFRVQAEVEDVTLKYARLWPEANAVAGSVRIEGKTLSGKLTAARFGQSPLQEARLRIEDLFSLQPVLGITGSVDATLEDIAHTLGASPLRERAMPQLQGLSLSGTTKLALDMSLGLKRGMQRTVKGALAFKSNALQASTYGLTVEDLQGELTFAGNDWQSRNLHGTLAGRAVDLEIAGGPSSPGGVQFTLAGNADHREVLDQLALRAPALHALFTQDPAKPALEGTLRWRGRLRGEAGQRRLVLESTLAGMRVDLPAPLDKPAASELMLAIDLPLQGEGARETRVSVGEILQAAVRQSPGPQGDRRVTHLVLQFGAGPAPELQDEGLYLQGTVPVLPLGEWTGLLKSGGTNGLNLPTEVDVVIGSLTTLGQDFLNVQLRGAQDPVAWRLSVDSERIAGDITIPRDLASSPLTLNLKRLWLQSPAADRKGQAKLVPQRIPRLAMACASFHYNKLDLGQASLATTPTPQGLHLDSLVFQSEAAQIRAHGDWFLRDAVHESHFSIEVKAEELGSLLGSFGYEARAIKGGRTSLDIEAGWPGTPGDFTLERLTGSLNLSVRRGRLLDIEPGSGRLFGLLSLQTLPRRLSLDFADLFAKGYAFDRIEGWFKLENGNAYTNTLFMEGPSSRVEVMGRTGLASKDYDQKAIVTPALSKSIPLASAVFGPAGVGAGAAIYLGQKLFKGMPAQVDRFLQRRYSITGPWDKPVVEKL